MLIAVDLALLALYALVPGVVLGWGNAWRSRRVKVLRGVGALLALFLR